MNKKREIIKIDEEKCNGCGLCLPGCPEGALQIVEGKARLVRESYCDGLGACLGHCPEGALQIEKREADEYDARAVLAHLEEKSPELAEKHREHLRAHGQGETESSPAGPGAGCPSERECDKSPSVINNWPVKLRLIPPAADFLKNADLILVADCVPFICPKVHDDFFPGRTVAAGCPKLDDGAAYEDKLMQIMESVNIKSISVLFMEIACCRGFVRIVEEALQKSGSDLPVEIIQVSVEGEIMKKEIILPSREAEN